MHKRSGLFVVFVIFVVKPPVTPAKRSRVRPRPEKSAWLAAAIRPRVIRSIGHEKAQDAQRVGLFVLFVTFVVN